MVGKGRTSSEVLLNLLTRSLKEVCRVLEEVEDTDADGPLKADESEVDRYAGRLAREYSKLSAGSGDTLSVRSL